MNKRTAFQYKILAIMMVIMVLVSITGIYAYKRFSQIVTSISKEARVDMRLITAKSLMNDVAEAENSVKSYSLIRDTLYLNKFYKAAERSNDKLRRLHKYSADKKILSHEIDTLEILIAEKFNVLNELLVIQDKYRVQTALDKVIINIEKKDTANNGKLIEETTKTELKPNIIQRIFGCLLYTSPSPRDS